MAKPLGQGQDSLPKSGNAVSRFGFPEHGQVGVAFRKALAASGDDWGKFEMTASNPQFKDQPPASGDLSWKKIVLFTIGAAVSSASNQSVPVSKGLSSEQIADKNKIRHTIG